MQFQFDAMSAATCATVAQIMPVFVVALIAERIVFRRSPEAGQYPATQFAVLFRIVIDLALALALLGTSALALIGVELRGLAGSAAETVWFGSGLLAVLIVYRWLLLSTPLLAMVAEASRVWARAVEAMLEGANLVTAVPIRTLGVAGDVFLTALSAGLFPVMEQLTDGFLSAVRLLGRFGRKR